MADGRVTYAAEGGWHVLRYFGRVDYTMAPAIERFVENLAHASPPARPFVFDVTDASILDSTNLGLIARLVERVRVEGAGRCTVVAKNGDIDDVMRSMGFEEIVDLAEHAPPQVGTPGSDGGPVQQELVTDESASQGEMLRTMLEAHRALIGLDDQDCAQWRDVVTMLEAEMRTR
jgi:anti-anti-sigma factor